VTLSWTRIAGTLGARVEGVDVTALEDDAFGDIQRLFLDHHVLVFPGQRLTPAQQVHFGERWGELLVHPIIPHVEGYPPIVAIENLGKGRTLTEFWHSDVTFEAKPPSISMLYARDIPEAGGDTLFANQHLAYERLSPGLKAMLAGRRAVHSGRGLGAAAGKGEAWQQQGELHPVVRTHPETGRKALFVNVGFTVAFEDMTQAESHPLLRFLYQQATTHDLTMRHAWREGDLLLWDNRSVQHYAIHDHGEASRTLHRITVAGDTPR